MTLNSLNPSLAPASADFLGFTCFFQTCLTPSNLAWFWQTRGSICLAHFQLSNGGIGVWIRSNLDFWWFYKPRLSDLPFAGISQPAKMLQLMYRSRSNKPRLSIRMDTLTFWAELVHVVPWPAAVYPCAKTCVKSMRNSDVSINSNTLLSVKRQHRHRAPEALIQVLLRVWISGRPDASKAYFCLAKSSTQICLCQPTEIRTYRKTTAVTRKIILSAWNFAKNI